jgi:hypothetical protein
MSRLTLEITDVRVERVQDIGGEDAKAEGSEWINPPVSGVGLSAEDIESMGYEIGFRDLWESINGCESWDANPYVWTLSFKVHHRNVDAFLQGREAA